MGVNVREKIAMRAAKEIQPRMIVNLGIGIPSLVPNYISIQETVFFQAENGILGVSDTPIEGNEDENLCNAGGHPVTLRSGGSYFDSANAFAMIRKGKIDITILGALQVSEKGDLANWIVPGKKVPGIGGAMELAGFAKKVIVTMSHCDKNGMAKIVRNCNLPLTSKACVQMVITEMGVFKIKGNEMILTEIFAPYRVDDVIAATTATFTVPDSLVII